MLNDRRSGLSSVSFPRGGELDPVTSLPPRRSYDEDLPRLLKWHGMERLPLCALMVDIDHFKKFNDRFGHAVGDMVLFHVSRLIRDGLRYRGEAYRYGGEEIIGFLFNCSRAEGLETARRLVRTVRESPLSIPADDPVLPAEVRGEGVLDLGVTVSIGVCSTADVTGDELIVMADRALYEAKESGRDTAVEYTPRIGAPAGRVTISVAFRAASSVTERNRIIIRSWFPLSDSFDIEARDLLVLDTNTRELVDLCAPRGGLILSDIPGSVASVEKRRDQTFFDLEVKSETHEVICNHVSKYSSPGS